jgi:hypothetical protein
LEQIGPLPVEVYIEGSRLVLRHAGGDLSFTLLEGAGALQLCGLMAVAAPPRAHAKAEPAPRPETCQAPGCGKPLEQASVVRPKRYCAARCGMAARKEARERTEAEERAVGRPTRSRLMDRMRDQLHRGAA